MNAIGLHVVDVVWSFAIAQFVALWCVCGCSRLAASDRCRPSSCCEVDGDVSAFHREPVAKGSEAVVDRRSCASAQLAGGSAAPTPSPRKATDLRLRCHRVALYGPWGWKLPSHSCPGIHLGQLDSWVLCGGGGGGGALGGSIRRCQTPPPPHDARPDARPAHEGVMHRHCNAGCRR